MTEEDDIKLDLTPNSQNSSKDDPNRRELLWDRREEKIFHEWIKQSKAKVQIHKRKEKFCKMKNIIFSVPCIVIPIISSGLSGILPCNSLENSILMMIVGILNCINTFFDFGRKQEKHGIFANRYFSLITEVESELSKPKRDRVACDLYIEKIKQMYNNLHLTEPS